jgi:hypothetical protein
VQGNTFWVLPSGLLLRRRKPCERTGTQGFPFFNCERLLTHSQAKTAEQAVRKSRIRESIGAVVMGVPRELADNSGINEMRRDKLLDGEDMGTKREADFSPIDDDDDSAV